MYRTALSNMPVIQPLDCLMESDAKIDARLSGDTLIIQQNGKVGFDNLSIRVSFGACSPDAFSSIMARLRQMPCVKPRSGTIAMGNSYPEGHLELCLTGHMDCRNCRHRPV